MPSAAVPFQPSLADLGAPLHTVTFVVVDLETTGGSPRDSRITEFGAVKVRGGEMLGEFQSLVDPGQAIPTAVSALTGITDAMVAARPGVAAVLPSFLEFCDGAALVAHNARFDVGFLDAALTRLAYPRLANPVVCTAALARRLVRDEVRDCRLATLAQRFACRSQPTHRALPDARATVEVLHALLERAGSYGVVTLDDLVAFGKVRNAPLFRSRRHLADGLPSAPGVYAFTAAGGEILYVGKASDLRARVRSYFGADDRRSVVELLKEAAAVEHWVCPTPLEAAVREARLLHAHRPRWNRRGKNPERAVYLKLTAERFPRLSVVRAVRGDGGVYVGPLPSRAGAELAAAAIHDAVPLRRCTVRIGARTRVAPCALAEMGRCLSPCDGSVSPDRYAGVAALVAEAVRGDATPLFAPLQRRMDALAAAGRFEDAATVRDRVRALAAALDRTRRLAATAAAGALVVSRPGRAPGTVDVVAVDGGRLVWSASCRRPALAATVAAAGDLLPPRATAAAGTPAPTPVVATAAADEVDLVSRWLRGPAAVVHRCDGTLSSAVAGGRALADLAARLAAAQRGTGHPGVELAAKRTRR